MNMGQQELLQKPLQSHEIDFRVQSINRGGYATILAYKSARVDMHRLNDVLGVGCWQREHVVINGKEFCKVGVWNDAIQQWAWVMDTGTPSNAEAEKGHSSDAFKRACFNLGIGIELYDYPEIKVRLIGDKNNTTNSGNYEWYMENGKPKAAWGLDIKSWVWCSEFDSDGELTYLAAKDSNGLRFEYGTHSSRMNKQEQK